MEVMSHDRKRGAEHQPQADAAQNCLGQEELVIFVAETGQDQRDNVKQRRRYHHLEEQH